MLLLLDSFALLINLVLKILVSVAAIARPPTVVFCFFFPSFLGPTWRNDGALSTRFDNSFEPDWNNPDPKINSKDRFDRKYFIPINVKGRCFQKSYFIQIFLFRLNIYIYILGPEIHMTYGIDVMHYKLYVILKLE